MAERGRDVVAGAMPWLLENQTKREQTDRFPAGLEGDLSKMLEGIQSSAVHVDELVTRSGLGAARALEVLLELELRGLVSRNPGMRFSRRVP
jgi:predicted Rossmann fold nucleotide-binding protein DprA/Smf involved in DNA uptake